MSDASRAAGSLTILAFIAVSLHGCGGGGSGGDTTVTTTADPGPAGPTTTSTVQFQVDSPCVADGDISKCVKYLNDQYMGYDETDPTSPLGITIRGQPRFNAKWFYCGTGCFNGQPDCYTAASILNHKIMLCQGYKCPVNNTPSMPMQYKVGIVFQPKAVSEQLTKCSWEYDGAAFKRTNGGCAAAPAEDGCNDNLTAYYDLCPETKKPIADDYSCPTVTRVECPNVEGSTDYPHSCYWRGAGFYSDTRPGDIMHPPNLTSGDDTGLRNMMKQRMGNQEGATPDGIPLLQYWNEVTMDGKILEAMLRWTPKAAIAAFMYQKGSAEAKGYADQYNEQMQKDYGITVPIVAMDINGNVSEKGPFEAPEASFASAIV